MIQSAPFFEEKNVYISLILQKKTYFKNNTTAKEIGITSTN